MLSARRWLNKVRGRLPGPRGVGLWVVGLRAANPPDTRAVTWPKYPGIIEIVLLQQCPSGRLSLALATARLEFIAKNRGRQGWTAPMRPARRMAVSMATGVELPAVPRFQLPLDPGEWPGPKRYPLLRPATAFPVSALRTAAGRGRSGNVPLRRRLRSKRREVEKAFETGPP